MGRFFVKCLILTDLYRGKHFTPGSPGIQNVKRTGDRSTCELRRSEIALPKKADEPLRKRWRKICQPGEKRKRPARLTKC